jgi:hypothetical protein
MAVKASPSASKQAYKVVISGTAYDAGVKTRFKVKPVRERKRGFGSQFEYSLTHTQLLQLAEVMTVLACDVGDEIYQYPSSSQADAEGRIRVEARLKQIYTDLGRFPAEAGVR